jgi:hypothetical protein
MPKIKRQRKIDFFEFFMCVVSIQVIIGWVKCTLSTADKSWLFLFVITIYISFNITHRLGNYNVFFSSYDIFVWGKKIENLSSYRNINEIIFIIFYHQNWWWCWWKFVIYRFFSVFLFNKIAKQYNKVYIFCSLFTVPPQRKMKIFSRFFVIKIDTISSHFYTENLFLFHPFYRFSSLWCVMSLLSLYVRFRRRKYHLKFPNQLSNYFLFSFEKIKFPNHQTRMSWLRWVEIGESHVKHFLKFQYYLSFIFLQYEYKTH